MNFLLHRKIAICMLFIALTGLGYVSYKQLPVELLPNAELPMLFVQVTSAQDMDPSYVESIAASLPSRLTSSQISTSKLLP